MIHTNIYYKFKNIKENDDQIFRIEKDDFEILAIADGVSTCSKGRIASATICFALKKYFNRNPITPELTEYINKGIDEAIEELKEIQRLFEEHFVVFQKSLDDEKITKDNENISSEKDKNEAKSKILREDNEQSELSDDTTKSIIEDDKNNAVSNEDEINNQSSKKPEEQKPEDYEGVPRVKENIKDYAAGNDERSDSVTKSELIIKLEEIFLDLHNFNQNEFQNVNEFVTTLLNSIRQNTTSFNFQTTLSLSLLKHEKEFVELMSFNYGDSELLIVSVNPTAQQDKDFIVSQISHYKLQQGDLKSFISSSNGRNGRLDISTRRLFPDDFLFIGSDGTHFSKTRTESGNPYSPFHYLIIKCIKENMLDDLPILWFDKLKGLNGLEDDFSMFMVRVR